MKALLGTELGGGFGHLALLRPVAEGLIRRGAQVCLCVPEPEAVPPNLLPEGVLIRASPPRTAHARTAFGSFYDLMFESGLADEAYTQQRIAAWSGIFEEQRPDLVVANYAPFLCASALGACPSIVVGTGFEVPPTSFPRLRQRSTSPDAGRLVMEALRRVQRQRRRPIPETLSDIFPPASDCFVVSVSELDPYAVLRGGAPAGPLQAPPAQNGALDGAPLVYLCAHAPNCFRTLSGLDAARVPHRAVIRPECPRHWPVTFPAANFSKPPTSLDAELAHCCLVIHHGGFSLSQEALLRGVPQLLVPRNDEQELNALALEALGTGATLLNPQPALVARTVLALLADERLRARCAAVADRLRTTWTKGSIDGIIARCEALADHSSADPVRSAI